MKNFLQITAVALLLLSTISACKKKSTGSVTNTTTTNTEYIEVTIPYTKSKTLTDSIPGFPFSTAMPAMKDTFATKVDEMLATYAPTIKKEDIVSIKPGMMKVVIDNSTNQTLDFVNDSVNVFVDAYNANPANPRLVAFKKGIPLGAKEINFSVVDTDVKDYFYNEFMEFSLNFNNRPNEGMAANTTFIVSLEFKIKAKKP